MTPMNSSLEEVWHSAVTRQAAAAPSSHAHVIFRTDDSSRVGTFGGVDSSGNLLFAVETTSPHLQSISVQIPSITSASNGQKSDRGLCSFGSRMLS